MGGDGMASPSWALGYAKKTCTQLSYFRKASPSVSRRSKLACGWQNAGVRASASNNSDGWCLQNQGTSFLKTDNLPGPPVLQLSAVLNHNFHSLLLRCKRLGDSTHCHCHRVV